MTTTKSRFASSATSKAPTGRERSRRTLILMAVGGAAVLIALYLVYSNASDKAESTGSGASTSYDVGSPGIGETAPKFELESSTGGTVSLSDYQGESVLLYFQEGLMCQPCWDQITDLEKSQDAVKAAGIDSMVSITSDPADLIAQKVEDQGIAETPVLSDPDLAVSREYSTNQYGMMGDSRNGHSFVLVGPDGKIQWRADYGGAPDYTMYVPVDQMLADLRDGQVPTGQ